MCEARKLRGGEWMDGWMRRWMDGWNGWMEGKTERVEKTREKERSDHTPQRAPYDMIRKKKLLYVGPTALCAQRAPRLSDRPGTTAPPPEEGARTAAGAWRRRSHPLVNLRLPRPQHAKFPFLCLPPSTLSSTGHRWAQRMDDHPMGENRQTGQ